MLARKKIGFSYVFKEYLMSPYHLVEFRPWPIVGSVRGLFITRGLVGWFHG